MLDGSLDDGYVDDGLLSDDIDDVDEVDEVEGIEDEVEDVSDDSGSRRMNGFPVRGRLPDGKKVKTRDDLELRRKLIFKDRLSGMRISEIAKKYEVSVPTVHLDLRKERKRLLTSLKVAGNDLLVGDVLGVWDKLMLHAEDVFSELNSGKDKINALNVMVKIVKGKVEFLFNTGLLKKIDPETEVPDEIDGVNIKKVSLPALMNMVEGKIKRISEIKRSIESG